jgi:hypothetical protein
MIHESKIPEASFDVRLKAKDTRAFERGNVVFVVPDDESKVFREVHFLSGGWVLCVDAWTKEPCKANEVGKRCCYHIFSAKHRKDINAKRRATLVRKKSGGMAA